MVCVRQNGVLAWKSFSLGRNKIFKIKTKVEKRRGGESSRLCNNSQPTAFHISVLWLVTQNAVGVHICHFVIDMFFIFQPSHRAAAEPFSNSPQNVEQQRHLASTGVLKSVLHQTETNVMWTQRSP